jgi:hypothetical protein
MSTVRVCVECYDADFKSHPQQLQKAEGPAELRGQRLLADLVAQQKARGLRS